MKRKSRSSPPATKRTDAEPGTPVPFTADIARGQRQRDFPGASPNSAQKASYFRKQLFQKPMVNTRTMVTNSFLSDPEQDASLLGPSELLHQTPPEQLLVNPDDLIEQAVNPRQRQPPQRERDPPDLQDVLTQQTEVLAGMMAELGERQQQPAQQGNAAEPPADPAFNWARLALPSETNFQVPGDRLVQWMATSLFVKVPTLAGRERPTRSENRPSSYKPLARPVRRG